MKKATFVNLIIIISLLIFCVMTLIAIYATAPDSSVLLLEENFNILNENKWRHEISECKEDGERYHYEMENGENGFIADGILRIKQNSSDLQYKSKRETSSKCSSCINSENSTPDCAPLFSSNLQTRHAFNVSCGRIEVRAKVRSGSRVRFFIKISPNQNSSKPREQLESFLESANETGTNNSAEFGIFFESISNEAIIKIAITDDDFHLYEINWDNEKISLSVDALKIDEKKVKLFNLEESISNTTVDFNGTPIIQPFVLNIGVNFEENLEHAEEKTPLQDTAYKTQDGLKEKSLFEMDYIKFFKVFN